MQKSSLKDSLVKTMHDVEDRFEQELYDRWHIRLHKRIQHHVHRLSKKPDNHKDMIAFGFAFGVTLIVFIGWYFISFPRIIDSYKTGKKESTAVHGTTNPIEGIKGQLYNENIQTE